MTKWWTPNKDLKYFSIYVFNVSDYPENIMNASEIIEKAFTTKVTVSKTPRSFFHNSRQLTVNRWLVDKAKQRFRNFAAESIVSLSVYISKETDRRLKDKFETDSAFKADFISCQFGTNVPTITDINLLLNAV